MRIDRVPWLRRNPARDRAARRVAVRVWDQLCAVYDAWEAERRTIEAEGVMELLKRIESLISILKTFPDDPELCLVAIQRVYEFNEDLERIALNRRAALWRIDLVRAMDAGDRPLCRRIERKLDDYANRPIIPKCARALESF